MGTDSVLVFPGAGAPKASTMRPRRSRTARREVYLYRVWSPRYGDPKDDPHLISARAVTTPLCYRLTPHAASFFHVATLVRQDAALVDGIAVSAVEALRIYRREQATKALAARARAIELEDGVRWARALEGHLLDDSEG